MSGRSPEAGAALAAELRDLGSEAECVHADVRYEADVRQLVEATVSRFGRLDVAVNNAGAKGWQGPVTEFDQAEYAGTFGTNVLGTLLAVKHQMRAMLGQRSGAIINLPSILGGGKLAQLARAVPALRLESASGKQLLSSSARRQS